MYTQSLAELSKKYLGIPYRWGGYDETGLDCSGMAQLSLRDLIPEFHTPKIKSQTLYYWLLNHGYCTEEKDIQQDDLLFFGKSKNEITHVSIALNRWNMIEAARGDRDTLTLEDAIKKGAFVVCRPITSRSDMVAILRLI